MKIIRGRPSKQGETEMQSFAWDRSISNPYHCGGEKRTPGGGSNGGKGFVSNAEIGWLQKGKDMEGILSFDP